MLTTGKFNRVAVAVALSLGVATSAVAASGQSSAMRGQITGPQGDPATDTTLTIIHQPSGTAKTVSVNGEGVFSTRGLRVGGPYQIIVDSNVFEDQVVEGVYLNLNDSFDLDVQLKAKTDVERILVTSSRILATNSGSSSVFGEKAIGSMATFNRDLKDVVRANPLANVSADGVELSVAGSNPKYNAITIDGVGINDTFGLESNGYPTSRSPISLEAVSQIAIDYAPFTARAGKFGGGNVNVVTKSGTNEFHGSLYYEYVPWAGTAKDGDDEFDIDNNETTFGAALSGSLIENKLFFFANYEKWEEDVEFLYSDIGPGKHDVSTAAVNEFVDIMDSVYGLTDSIASAPPADSDEKLLIKLDWNIAEGHRADFTYSNQESKAARNYTDSDSTLNMQSNGWAKAQDTTYYTAHLYSDWNERFNTEVSLSYKDFSQESQTNSNWGEINVRNTTCTGEGEEKKCQGTIVAGQDENRHANVLRNEVTTFAFHAAYLFDNAEVKAGFEIEDTWNYNLYGRGSAGTWTFDSLDDFRNKKIDSLEYGNAYTNDIQDIAYDVNSTQYSLYGEVNFELFQDVMVNAGVRYEYLSVDDAPQLNENFKETYKDLYGFDNRANLDGFDILLPRVSFNWDVTDDLILRGGVGRFSGGMPLVWISNAYTNDGVTKDSANVDSLDGSEVDFTAVPVSVQSMLAQGAGSTNLIDPNFKLPSDWRSQIAADVLFDVPMLGDDFAWTTEFTYVDRTDAAFWKDISRVDKGRRAKDGRIMWDNVYTGTDYEGNYDLMLTNAGAGHSSIITTSLNKSWNNGVRLNISYAHQDITEAAAGTNSTAESNYQYDVTRNRNIPLIGTAAYEIEHSLKINLNYKTEFFAGYSTNMGLFFERRSGRPMSWTLGAYKDMALGDQYKFSKSGYYQIYLPSGADDAAFDFDAKGALSYEEIMDIAKSAGVDQYAGGYIPKGAVTQPWVSTLDLNLSQEIPGLFDGHKGSLSFTIVNLANMLNDDWGQVHRTKYINKNLYDYDLNDQGQYVYKMPYSNNYKDADGVRRVDTRTYDQFKPTQSTWRIKVGLRYNF